MPGYAPHPLCRPVAAPTLSPTWLGCACPTRALTEIPQQRSLRRAYSFASPSSMPAPSRAADAAHSGRSCDMLALLAYHTTLQTRWRDDKRHHDSAPINAAESHALANARLFVGNCPHPQEAAKVAPSCWLVCVPLQRVCPLACCWRSTLGTLSGFAPVGRKTR